MKSFALFAAICALALGAEAPKTASAGTITETINFTASGFHSFTPGFSVPVDPVIGSFTITLDPTITTIGTTITLKPTSSHGCRSDDPRGSPDDHAAHCHGLRPSC